MQYSGISGWQQFSYTTKQNKTKQKEKPFWRDGISNKILLYLKRWQDTEYMVTALSCHSYVGHQIRATRSVELMFDDSSLRPKISPISQHISLFESSSSVVQHRAIDNVVAAVLSRIECADAILDHGARQRRNVDSGGSIVKNNGGLGSILAWDDTDWARFRIWGVKPLLIDNKVGEVIVTGGSS